LRGRIWLTRKAGRRTQHSKAFWRPMGRKEGLDSVLSHGAMFSRSVHAGNASGETCLVVQLVIAQRGLSVHCGLVEPAHRDLGRQGRTKQAVRTSTGGGDVFSDNLFDDCDAGNRWLWRGPKRFYSGQWRSKRCRRINLDHGGRSQRHQLVPLNRKGLSGSRTAWSSSRGSTIEAWDPERDEWKVVAEIPQAEQCEGCGYSETVVWTGE